MTDKNIAGLTKQRCKHELDDGETHAASEPVHTYDCLYCEIERLQAHIAARGEMYDCFKRIEAILKQISHKLPPFGDSVAHGQPDEPPACQCCGGTGIGPVNSNFTGLPCPVCATVNR